MPKKPRKMSRWKRLKLNSWSAAKKFKAGGLVLKKNNAAMVSYVTARCTGLWNVVGAINEDDSTKRLTRYFDKAVSTTTVTITQLKEFQGYKLGGGGEMM
jgi:hypothetical protein